MASRPPSPDFDPTENRPGRPSGEDDPRPEGSGSPVGTEMLEDLFGELIDLPDGAARSAFIDELARDRPGLARELRDLLAAHTEPDEFLDGLDREVARSAPFELDQAAGTALRVGPYRLLDVLGRGGMGVVYRAVRVEGGFDQEVALKLLHLDMDSPGLRARFEAERQLLARLDHRSIARLLDGGVTEEGRPFIVMERVDGRPITEHCRAEALSTREVVRLFSEVIGPVSYLHRNLVVHRDLKPGNVFVDARGRVKLLDFGIAKLLAAEEEESRPATRTGDRLLTPRYAAPEQLAGEPVTTATDVYALGLVLHELLTGRLPDGSPGTAPTSQEPVGPGRGDDPTSEPPLRRMPRDLRLVCDKALRPEPEHRYASAADLDRDLERFLDGRPVEAGPGTLRYRVTSFLRRHRKGVAAALLATGLATFGVSREVRLRQAAESSRELARTEAAKAVAVSDFLAELLSSVDPAKAQGRDPRVLDVLEEAARRLDDPDASGIDPLVEASLRLTIGTTYTSLGRGEEALPHLERALALRRVPGVSEEDRLDVLEAIAKAYYGTVRQRDAEELFRRVLDGRTRLLGEEHPDTLRALGNLADSLWQQGRYEEVETLDRRTVQIRRRVLGPDRPETLEAVNGLAATLFSLGRTAEAAELFEQALQIQRRNLGPKHPETLMLGNNLGSAWLEIGRYREADALLTDVLEGRLEVLGERRGDTAMTMHNLALTRAALGDVDDALRLLRRAVEIRRQVGASALRRLESESHLADLLRNSRDFDAAARLYRSVSAELEGLERPAARREVWRIEIELAELERLRGDPRRALARLDSALAKPPGGAKPGDPDEIRPAVIRARALADLDRHDEAVAEIAGALDTARDRLGEDHPITVEARIEQVGLLAAAGRTAEAAAEGRSLLPLLEERLGTEHPDAKDVSRIVRRADDRRGRETPRSR